MMLHTSDAAPPEQKIPTRLVSSGFVPAGHDVPSVLQLSHFDIQGARFNGHDLMRGLEQRGFPAGHLVWIKERADSGAEQMFNLPGVRRMNRALSKVEQLLSIQSLLYPWAFGLPVHRQFRRADIVHLHLIHTGYFSLAALPMLSRLKPIVWTLHDPWALTGHCIHPYGCDRWQAECGNCPSLSAAFAMRRDHTRFMHRAKRRIYGASNLDIVVASRWMLDSVQKSPLLGQARTHLIPFGLDLDLFSPGNKVEAKKRLKIDEDTLVIAFRSTSSEFKGLKYIIEALHKLKTTRDIAILTFNEQGHLKSLIGKYQLVELGWLNDPVELTQALRAADVFLMPSMAESFGMMALEAIACGVPTIVTRDSPMEDFVINGVNGFSVARRDSSALADAMDRLLDSDAIRDRFGREARRVAVETYGIDRYIDADIELYEEIGSRNRTGIKV